MDDETLRKMAIQQYLQDKSPASIYRDMGRSKKWFFKWLRRYQSGDPNWYHDQSRAPRSHPNQTSPEMRQLIINIRTQLEEHPYAQIGTSAINWEFKKLGATPPSNSTINRTLKRQGFVKKNSLYPPRESYTPISESLWASITSIRQISWVPGTSRTMDVSIHSMSSIARATEFFSIPNEGKTTRP
jgi:hypothetical protein